MLILYAADSLVLLITRLLFLIFFIVLLVCQLRYNSRFTRRLKRKPIPIQKHSFNAKPQWVIDAVIRLKVFMPASGVRMIAMTFNRIYGKRATVSKNFVARILRNYRYAITIRRREMRSRKPVAIPANATWGLDLCGKQDAKKVVHPILGIVDHGSRVAITLTAIRNMSFYTLAGHLLIAIGRFGKPHALRTDNASILVSKRFRWFLRLFNIRHQRSDVGCPWQNGFIERLFGTLKQKLNQINVDNGAQLNFALHEFNTWYNEIRPHQGLDGRTPAEAWAWLTECISAKQFEEKVIESVAPFVAWEGLLTGYRIRWKCP